EPWLADRHGSHSVHRLRFNGRWLSQTVFVGITASKVFALRQARANRSAPKNGGLRAVSVQGRAAPQWGARAAAGKRAAAIDSIGASFADARVHAIEPKDIVVLGTRHPFR